MAQAVTLRYSKLRVLLGDGGSPEAFDFPCGLNSRALNRSKALNEIDIPDCDDEDAPAWIGREVRSLDWSVTGEGVLDESAQILWDAFFDDLDPRNVRIELEKSTGILAWEGRAHLQTYNVTGNRGEKVGVNIELVGDGALVSAASI